MTVFPRIVKKPSHAGTLRLRRCAAPLRMTEAKSMARISTFDDWIDMLEEFIEMRACGDDGCGGHVAYL